MDTATPRTQSAFLSSLSSRRKGPIAPLRIDTPPHATNVALVSEPDTTSASALSSATSDPDPFLWPPPPSRSHSRNMKRLSLSIPSAQSSTASLFSPLSTEPSKRIAPAPPPDGPPATRRRPSVVSLPSATSSSFWHRKDEDADGDEPGSVPYLGGPIQILPGIWLGNEDNARDWRTLLANGIKSVLNVAKEVTCPIEGVPSQTLRSVTSHSDLALAGAALSHSGPVYYPAHLPSGRPGMHYLQLPWSHGQSDLVTEGFPSAMAFVDHALERGDGILIHCQCGVSRSATLMIALVMRAGAQCSPSVPPEVWALKSMHDAYAFVKQKSKWVGPNMSLIYQLLEYERSLKSASGSPAALDESPLSADEEWARRRQSIDEADSEDNESTEVMREARALDQAMEHRRRSRKSSVSSVSSNGIGMGTAWRSKYGNGRNRAASIASTTGSVLSEHLMEEDEERELLGSGGGFTETSCSSAEPTEDDASSTYAFGDSDSPADTDALSAPAHKSSFDLPPAAPATATAASFQFPRVRAGKGKPRKRPPPLFGLLPPVPSSPVTPVSDVYPPPSAGLGPTADSHAAAPEPAHLATAAATPRTSHAPSKPASALRKSFSLHTHSRTHHQIPTSATPAQTLFVFPPSPTLSARTPSTMTLLSTAASAFLQSPAPTPRVSTFKHEGRRRSFIGVGALAATPTTACSRVDARGWVGMS